MIESERRIKKKKCLLDPGSVAPKGPINLINVIYVFKMERRQTVVMREQLVSRCRNAVNTHEKEAWHNMLTEKSIQPSSSHVLGVFF